jgi:hypothetical protein
MASFEHLIDWLAAPHPGDHPHQPKVTISGWALTTSPSGEDIEVEWAGLLEFSGTQVHAVLGQFHGVLGPMNDAPRSAIEVWLSIAANRSWAGIVGGELSDAWREDVPVTVTRIEPPASVWLEVRQPGERQYLAVDLVGTFRTEDM